MKEKSQCLFPEAWSPAAGKAGSQGCQLPLCCIAAPGGKAWHITPHQQGRGEEACWLGGRKGSRGQGLEIMASPTPQGLTPMRAWHIQPLTNSLTLPLRGIRVQGPSPCHRALAGVDWRWRSNCSLGLPLAAGGLTWMVLKASSFFLWWGALQCSWDVGPDGPGGWSPLAGSGRGGARKAGSTWLPMPWNSNFTSGSHCHQASWQSQN